MAVVVIAELIRSCKLKFFDTRVQHIQQLVIEYASALNSHNIQTFTLKFSNFPFRIEKSRWVAEGRDPRFLFYSLRDII